MPKMLAQVVREALRAPQDPINVLLFRSEDDIDLALLRGAPAGSVFYAVGHNGERPWDLDRLTPPDNLVFLDWALGENQIPADVPFDLVVCPLREPFVHNARKASAALHAPLVTLMVDPPSRSSPGLMGLAGHVRVYPTAEAAEAWGDCEQSRVAVATMWRADALGKVLDGAARAYELKWEIRV